jgi:hypothetical protein
MKKHLYELNSLQVSIYEYLKSVVTQDGGNFKDLLTEMEEGFDIIPDRIYNIYQSLNPIERIETIHFFTRYLMKKNKG